MRPIDADAFDKRCRIAGGMAEGEMSEDFQDGVLAVLELLKTQPIIEPRKGKWITKSTNGEMFDSCSVCGYVEWDVPRNFCPCCGADMREGGQDDLGS